MLHRKLRELVTHDIVAKTITVAPVENPPTVDQLANEIFSPLSDHLREDPDWHWTHCLQYQSCRLLTSDNIWQCTCFVNLEKQWVRCAVLTSWAVKSDTLKLEITGRVTLWLDGFRSPRQWSWSRRPSWLKLIWSDWLLLMMYPSWGYALRI